MVDLPLPQPQLVVSEPPQQKVGADVFQPIQIKGRTDASQGIAALGQGLEDVAVPLAKRQAAEDLQKSVTRNPDGSMNVTTPATSFILGRAGEAYNAAVSTGVVASTQTNMLADFTNMARDHINDPAGFQKAAGDYLDQRRANNPGAMGEAIFRDGSRLAVQHYDGLVNQKAALDVNNAHQAILTQIEDHKNQLAALARQGGTGTPDFIKGSKELDALYDSLGTNPLFKISPEKIASEKQRSTDLLQAEAIIGHVDSTFTRTGPGGGRAAAQKILEDEILNNPKLNIPEQERNRLYNLGLHRLEYLGGDQKAKVDANRGTVNETLTAIHAGRDLPDGMLDQVITNAQNLGDSESVSKLQAARDIYGISKATAQGTPEQQFNAHFPGGGPHPVAAPVPTGQGGQGWSTWKSADGTTYAGPNAQRDAGAGAVQVQGAAAAGAPGGVTNTTADMIKHFEGFRTTPYMDHDVHGNPAGYRVGYGSDTITRADGTVVKVQPGIAVSPADADRDLARRAGETQSQIQGQIGGDAWARLGDKAQAAMTSVAYNYGHLPGSVVQAAKSGDPEAVAAAIAGLPANPSRRRQEAASILGYAIPAGSTFQGKTLTMPSSVNGVPFTAAQVQQNPFLLSEQVRQAASDDRNTLALARQIGPAIESGLRAGFDPNPETLANFMQLASKHTKELGEQAQNIEAMVKGNALAMSASGLPLGEGQAKIDQAKAMAQGSSIYQQKLAEQAQSQFIKRTQEHQTDPMGDAVKRNWIPRPPIPLDPSNGDAFSQGLLERRTAAAMIGSYRKEPPAPLMFSAADTKGMANFLQSAPPGGAQNLLNGLVGGLKPEEMDALMASPDMKAAISGLTRSGDPAKMGAAYGALDAIYRNGNAETFKKDFGPEALSDLRYWQSHLAFLPPDQLAKEMRRNDDPGVMKARKDLEQQADAGPLKGLTPAQVIKKFGGWFTSAGAPASEAPAMTAMALKDDYEQAFRMQYGKTGSAADSDKFAQENIAQKWGTSDANNSRVMAYPPERYYPQVGGSTDYVRTQLNDFVRNRAGAQGVELPAPAQAFMPGLGLVQTSPVAETAEQQRALNIASGAHALVPDAQTQAEIANRQLPGYQVVVSDTSGQFHLLMDGDRPARFHGDPTQPQATAEQRFTTAHDRAARAGEAIRGMESMVPWGQP